MMRKDYLKMKAAVFRGEGKLVVQEIPAPVIREKDDVMLKVEAASICGSDLHALSVPPAQHIETDIVMGHEFCARVIETGAGVKNFKTGDRVAVEPIIRCGMCPECRSGHDNLCRNNRIIGQKENGGFAEYVVVPEKALYHIPETIPAKTAALTEPLACVMNGISRLNPMPHQKALIFGAGPIGQIFICVLRSYGLHHIAVSEMNEERAKTALKLGAEFVLENSGLQQGEEQFLNQWGDKPDIVIDAVGAGATLEESVELVKEAGTILIFGQNMRQEATIRPGVLVSKELNIMTSIATHRSFQIAIDMLSDPDLHLEQIVTHELSLDRILEGIDLMRSGKAGKVVIYPQEQNG